MVSSGLLPFPDLSECAGYLNGSSAEVVPSSNFSGNNGSCLTNFSSPTTAANDIRPDAYLVEFLDQSRFWVQRVFVPLLMIIGVIGNSITIFIMTRRRMRSSTNIYLAALAIFDMMYLVCIFWLSIQHYPNMRDVEYYVYWRVWPFALMLADASSNTSVWLTVTFTFERYIAVSHPIRGKVLCTESRAKKAIVAVAFICFTITLPTPFEWIIVENTDPDTNRTYLMPTNSDLGNNHIYKSIYYWLVVVLFILVPFFLLAIFNAFLIRSVHLSKKARKSMTGRREATRDSSTQENKITVMLIAVVMLFFFCQLPTAVILLYTSFKNAHPMSNEFTLLRGLGNIFNFLMAINAAGNFVLYCLLSQKYRRTFLQTFCPCLKGKITRLHSVYQHTMYSNVDSESPSVNRKLTVRPGAPRDVFIGRSSQITLERVEKINGASRKSSFLDPTILKAPLEDCNNAASVETCADCSVRMDHFETNSVSSTASSRNKRRLSNTLLERLNYAANSDEDAASAATRNAHQLLDNAIVIRASSGTLNSSL